jgi:1-acyl-sn-glycerol-3-phosphate acyltransferase
MDHDAELTATAVAPPAGVISRVWGAVATILSVLITAILLIPAAFVARFKDGHYVSPLMRLWAWLIYRTCGNSAEVEGLEHIRGLDSFILVANHQSLFDIVAIVLLPCEVRFVAKQEIARVPLLGYVLGRSRNIVIERQSGDGRFVMRLRRRARATVSRSSLRAAVPATIACMNSATAGRGSRSRLGGRACHSRSAARSL